MDKASETLYRLKPVTFKFNSDWKGTTQYGLIAEEVAEVDPQLVVHARMVKSLPSTTSRSTTCCSTSSSKNTRKFEALEATVAQQQKGMEVLTAQLKKQAALIQKVSAQLEMSKPAAKVVVNKP